MAKRFKVVIADFIADGLEPERGVLGDIADLEALNAHDEGELAGQIEEADAIMVYHSLSLSRRTIERLRRCRLIVRCGVGYDNVEWGFARQVGIPVANVPEYGTEEVADTAIGFMLALTRGIAVLNSRLRAGYEPWMYTQVVPLQRLRGRIFGIVGLGRIGTAAALRAKTFGMEVCYYDPYKPDGYDKALGVRRVENLAELLEQVYVVSLHCPLTEETCYMIDAPAISRMPRGSYLVNTARGGILDTSAIPGAIESGHLAGAGIDVLEHEPPCARNSLMQAWRNPDHPAHDRVLINPHSAFYCEQGLLEMRVKGAGACRQALLGNSVRNIINGT